MSGNYPDGVTGDDIDKHYGADKIADLIDTAYVPHALAVIAYALGYGDTGDAADIDISDALVNDGIPRDDEDRARAVMDRYVSSTVQAIKVLTDEFAAMAKRAAARDAKAAKVAA